MLKSESVNKDVLLIVLRRD